MAIIAEFGRKNFPLKSRDLPSSLRVIMRFIVTLLLVFCIAAGLNARVFAVNCSAVTECGKVPEPCCQDDHEGGNSPENHHNGGDCPMEHHHHGFCSHGLPLGVDIQTPARLTVPGSMKLSFRHEGDVPPDGPFLGSEKPPLI